MESFLEWLKNVGIAIWDYFGIPGAIALFIGILIGRIFSGGSTYIGDSVAGMDVRKIKQRKIELIRASIQNAITDLRHFQSYRGNGLKPANLKLELQYFKVRHKGPGIIGEMFDNIGIEPEILNNFRALNEVYSNLSEYSNKLVEKTTSIPDDSAMNSEIKNFIRLLKNAIASSELFVTELNSVINTIPLRKITPVRIKV